MVFFAVLFIALQGCNESPNEITKGTIVKTEEPDYFLLRPKLEKEYGYSHAVRIRDE